MSVIEGDNTTPNNRVSLADVVQAAPADCVKLFCSSLQSLLQYGYKDIEDTLLKLNMETLHDIHRDLADNIKSSFRDYSEKIPKKRQKKNTIIPDIYSMGHSLIHKAKI